MEKGDRYTVQFAESQDRWLRLWARLNGRPPATFISQVVSARLEANLATILDGVEKTAIVQGVTRDELIASWLEEPDSD